MHFSWVTNIEITSENAFYIMKEGRSRWKIENETFNTLKNQGYHFEHNFGHGYKNLSSVLALLMLLAFLIDQLLALCCQIFKAISEKLNTKRRTWETFRVLFCHAVFSNWKALYQSILKDRYTIRTSKQVYDTS